jgi:membrane protease YdiL (CAAX protease family)
MTGATPSARSPLAFVLALLALAIPIWLVSRFVSVIDLLKVPVTDLMLAFTPLIAAVLLVYRNEGAGGLLAFLQGSFDFPKLARTAWLVPVLLLAPLIDGLTYVALHLAGHGGVPDPNLSRLPILAAIMFVLAIGEEAGWTGYLTDPLQHRYGATVASLIIAVPWWLGHIPSIIEIGGSASDIGWWFPGAIALRVLIVWLYNNTGRCLSSAIVFHTLLNVCRSVSYPSIGSHYDPAYQSVGYSIASILATAVVIIYGPKTLTRVVVTTQ